MILDTPLYAQVDSGPVSGLDTISQTQQRINTLTSTSNTPNTDQLSYTNRYIKPKQNLMNFLKSKFFGKSLPMSDNKHIYTGRGVLIGIEKIDKNYYGKMIDVDSRSTFKALFIFEREWFGPNGRDLLRSNTPQLAPRLDSEQRLTSSIGPLIEHTDASPLVPGADTSPSQLSEIPGEDVLMYNPSNSQFDTVTLVFVKGKPYFKDNGLPVFIRLEKASTL